MKKESNRKFIIIMSCFVVVTLLLTFFSKTIYYSKLPHVTVTVPCGGKLLNTVEVNSLVEHYHTNPIYSRQEGFIKTIYVEEGMQVTAGQVIMDFEVNQDVLYQLEEELQKKEQEIALLRLELKKEKNISPQESSALDKKTIFLEEELNQLISSRDALSAGTYTSPELETYSFDIEYGRMLLNNANAQLAAGEGSQAEVNEALYVVNKAQLAYNEYWDTLKKDNKKAIIEKEAELALVRQESSSINYDTGYAKTNLNFMIENAQLELKRMEENLTNIKSNQLVASSDGVIVNINIGQGSFVEQNALLYEIASQSEDYKTTVIVSEESLKFVELGQEATVDIGGYQNTVKGTIQEIEPYGDGQYKATIVLKDLDNSVAGKMASITITHTSKEYELIVPKAAVQKDDKGYYVMAVRKNDTIIGEGYLAIRVGVELIDSDDSLSAISGMFMVEPVILTSTKDVVSGQQVRYTP